MAVGSGSQFRALMKEVTTELDHVEINKPVPPGIEREQPFLEVLDRTRSLGVSDEIGIPTDHPAEARTFDQPVRKIADTKAREVVHDKLIRKLQLKGLKELGTPIARPIIADDDFISDSRNRAYRGDQPCLLIFHANYRANSLGTIGLRKKAQDWYP